MFRFLPFFLPVLCVVSEYAIVVPDSTQSRNRGLRINEPTHRCTSPANEDHSAQCFSQAVEFDKLFDALNRFLKNKEDAQLSQSLSATEIIHHTPQKTTVYNGFKSFVEARKKAARKNALISLTYMKDEQFKNEPGKITTVFIGKTADKDVLGEVTVEFEQYGNEQKIIVFEFGLLQLPGMK